MRWVVIAVLVLAALGLGYIRLAPSEPARWHVAVPGDADVDVPGGAVRVIAAGPEALAAAANYMQDLPRTRLLAGSVAEGRLTYVTRSLVFGFPDYTTLEHADGRLRAHARLRFGYSDMGVNRRRLEGLVAALQ